MLEHQSAFAEEDGYAVSSNVHWSTVALYESSGNFSTIGESFEGPITVAFCFLRFETCMKKGNTTPKVSVEYSVFFRSVTRNFRFQIFGAKPRNVLSELEKMSCGR